MLRVCSGDARSVPFTRSERAGSAPGVCPAKYDPAKALPLRVPSELRARLDAVTGSLPLALRLPRNTVAVLALARGLEELGAELHRDPMALHRALAGVGSAPEGTEHAPRAPGAPSGDAPAVLEQRTSTTTERAPSSHASRPPASTPAPSTPRRAAPAGDAASLDSEALRERWQRSGLGVTAFARSHGIQRSVVREWLNGAETRPKTLARIAAALDAEGK